MQQLLSFVTARDPARVEHIAAMGVAERHLDILLDDEQRGALLAVDFDDVLARVRGDLLMRINSFAISFGDKTKSTAPAVMADCGILLNLAELFCAKVNPPAALMASNPRVPSLALPLNTTPIAFFLCISASDEKKVSIGKCTTRSLVRAVNCMWPSNTVISLSGGMI